jgi:peptide deformylase
VLSEALAIECWGSPVLHAPAAEVHAVNDELRELVRRMFVTMYGADGQGLAAPQVGVSLRVAIVDVPPHGGQAMVLLNPRIVATGVGRIRAVEGCLSLPGVWGRTERWAEVTVEASRLDETTVRLEAAGELGRCLQHEIDHLDGILYTRRMSPLARRLLLTQFARRQSHRPAG